MSNTYHFKLVAACVFVCCFLNIQAQPSQRATSGELYASLQRLRVLASALYVAAHPDDENTRVISYLANDRKAHTTYLSITRGDGGQNLIGPEISELLGVIRTQELLQARRTDHGHQRFTRANDFGYSKTPDETLKIWNKDAVLSDVVWAIRMEQPDIIINRFTAAHLVGNHGHHTASAVLSSEAFDIAADPKVFPEQLEYVKPWQPARLLMNTSWWFYGSRENFDAADKSKMAKVDVGLYDPLTGWSNPEIAAMSRSMHKSQGFGSTPTRGTEYEYFEIVKGSLPGDLTELFDGIDITWNRVKGGMVIDKMLAEIESSYDFLDPSKSVKPLLQVRNAIQSLEPGIWKSRKLDELDHLLLQLTGIYLEADAAVTHVAPGDSVSLSLEAINRSTVPVELIRTVVSGNQDLHFSGTFAHNEKMSALQKVLVPAGTRVTTPYWLNETGSVGMYSVDDQLLHGLPETPRGLSVAFTLRILDDTIAYIYPVIYKETDPVKGEIYRPFEIVPPAFVNLSASVYVFGPEETKTIGVDLKSVSENVLGTLVLKAPEGWTVTPHEWAVDLGKGGSELHKEFQVTGTTHAKDGVLEAELITGDHVCNQMLTEIQYDHIPAQMVLRPSQSRVVSLDLKKEGHRIGYLEGAGDDVAECLSQVGYAVEIIDPLSLTSVQSLTRFDAVITGVRAYNTVDRLQHAGQYLAEYVAGGGTLIMQYNTSHGLVSDQPGPLQVKLGRKRVTEEDAAVSFLHPDHTVLNFPNKIGPADFSGWVQERGLYFAESWDVAFQPILAMADTGEEPLQGALLVGKHGKGHVVYSSLSFFRQLPDGVPGAYRLFANLIALGQNGKS